MWKKTIERNEAIVKAIKGGDRSQPSLCKRFGVSEETLRKIARDTGVTLDRNHAVERSKTLVILASLLNGSTSCARIAARHACSVQLVRRTCDAAEKAGIRIPKREKRGAP